MSYFTAPELAYSALTKMDGTPTATGVNKIIMELTEICVNVNSNLGGGMHGHSYLIMMPAAYVALTGVAFVPPINPGNGPIAPNPNTLPCRHSKGQNTISSCTLS
jgi:hypothetical protein